MKRLKDHPKAKPQRAAPKRRRAVPAVALTFSPTRIRELIDEATVDCHDDDEARMGFLSAIEEALVLPFETELLGAPAQVTAVEENEADDLVAVCRRGTYTQRVLLADLPLPSPPPNGAEWIVAWRRWRGEKD